MVDFVSIEHKKIINIDFRLHKGLPWQILQLRQIFIAIYIAMYFPTSHCPCGHPRTDLIKEDINKPLDSTITLADDRRSEMSLLRSSADQTFIIMKTFKGNLIWVSLGLISLGMFTLQVTSLGLWRVLLGYRTILNNWLSIFWSEHNLTSFCNTF